MTAAHLLTSVMPEVAKVQVPEAVFWIHTLFIRIRIQPEISTGGPDPLDLTTDPGSPETSLFKLQLFCQLLRNIIHFKIKEW
jgi:hypothetical protein